jgi:DNA-binding transcriptional MerR regulator
MEELAAETQTPERTIRYYLAEGFLPKADRHGQYSQRHLLRLRLIRRYREHHLKLDHLRAMRLAEMPEPEVEALLRQWDEVTPAPVTTESRAEEVPLNPAHALTASLLARQRQIAPGATLPPPPPSAPTPKRQEPASEVWHRVEIAPGIEIHHRAFLSSQEEAFLEDLMRFVKTRRLKSP